MINFVSLLNINTKSGTMITGKSKLVRNEEIRYHLNSKIFLAYLFARVLCLLRRTEVDKEIRSFTYDR